MTLYIVGAGVRAARSSTCAWRRAELSVAFLDDAMAGETVRGVPVLSPDAAVSGARYVVAIADAHSRIRLADTLDALSMEAETVVHPRALVAPDSSIGPGCVLAANSYVSSSVVIGRHCQVHYNATVGHDARLADYVTVYPGANISGSVDLGPGSSVGSNAVVLQGRSVGADAFVGAGAVVTRDVAASTVVVGSPARPISA